MKASVSNASTLISPSALQAFGAAVAQLAAELAVQLVAEQRAAAPEEPVSLAALVDVDGLAAALGVSPAHVRRMKREGCPVEWYGTSPRFDVAAVREWARGRGKKSVTPAAAPKVTAEPIPGVQLKTRKKRA